jgi:hypothetical protein
LIKPIQDDLFAVTDHDMVEPTPPLYKNYDRGNHNETRNRHPVPSCRGIVVLIDIVPHESIDVTSDSSSKPEAESHVFGQTTAAPEARPTATSTTTRSFCHRERRRVFHRWRQQQFYYEPNK